MKSKELQSKTNPDLRKLLSDLQEELRTLRFDLTFGKVKNTAHVKEVKKDISRILTILHHQK